MHPFISRAHGGAPGHTVRSGSHRWDAGIAEGDFSSGFSASFALLR